MRNPIEKAQWCFIITLLILAVALVASGEANAVSFNCQHAPLPSEQTICSNANLSRLDEQTAGMYFIIIGSGAPTATISRVKASQSQFLRRRNACGANVDCLVSAYTDHDVSQK